MNGLVLALILVLAALAHQHFGKKSADWLASLTPFLFFSSFTHADTRTHLSLASSGGTVRPAT